MRKRDLVDGLVGPRVREMMDQLLCMKGMTNAEKVDFLMSRNRELRAENEKLRVELTDLRLKSCPSCGIKVENEELRELCATVIDDWMSKVCPTFPFCEYGGEYQDCTDETCGNQIYKQMARELGVEVES